MNINQTSLTDTENLIMNTLWKYIDLKQKVNISIIADECFVSKATIIKLCKKLGYSGYSEMFYMLLASKKNSYSLEINDLGQLALDSTYNLYIQMISELLRYYKNDKILVDSLGFCDAARDYIIQKLLVFNFNANFCYHFEAFSNPSFHSGLYIVLSESGARGEILEKMTKAKENGFNIIAFTTDNNSPVAKMAHTSIQLKSKRVGKDHYEPNLFTAKILIFIEMVLSTYSKNFINGVED
ncbi:DNA-binding MurR/RpiR family transcriptional regulator [Breznakia sp. PF5-3]|uniref:MurR/RpiR family transcriptional regulator n=1 Tax=unclassified Breznakia TaxID=2623764 RepID=UPI002406B069|nr:MULTISPECIES: MurR/RpiR family transcriptional regulator [unclassified Breznakia]MDF9825224.1 DNA-binding MurR/RpiR family transcriptional regulator [Breznakia sp. PM6-1]MDF9836105.1 DNA-binding MurR/RpiR family transcriptional regulator [Breznakia sp. PF5-3]MDF9838745.1 DNA-binding MurR/RpiR family transcriptional regulator [Breznakia sp. PFB2-8]MDF9860767.1 DNA-binding MurR/RpiR family transcriptional regulator [Breznakia sp. PH5-24]